MTLRARSAIVLLWLAATACSARAFEPPPAVTTEQPEGADGLARQVYDVFRQQCIKCHGVAKAGGLDLRSEDGLRNGGTRGPVVVPHKPDDSPRFKYVSHIEAPFMPAGGGKLPDDSLELIRDWIESGASIATVPEASPNAAAAAAEMAKLEERPITAAAPEARTPDVWLAGGGIKGGTVVGTTDRYGYAAAENPKSVYELHATILHILGLDFEKLTYRFNGRDTRLTDVHGRVIKDVLA